MCPYVPVWCSKTADSDEHMHTRTKYRLMVAQSGVEWQILSGGGGKEHELSPILFASRH